MATVGGIYLGGQFLDGDRSRKHLSSVAFWLNAKARANYAYAPEDSKWEAELRSGQDIIVARSTEALSEDCALSSGREIAQQCLDCNALERNQALLTKAPDQTYVLLFDHDGKSTLRIVDFSAFAVSVGPVVVEVTDREGNVVSSSGEPKFFWRRALRYYRFSQASQDIFDAYRNLWLAFESLLNEVHPKSSSQREKDWLLQALAKIQSTINLSKFAPEGNTNPVAYIIGTQYDHIRLRLFHASRPDDLLPLESGSPQKVEMAYVKLLEIWRWIARNLFRVPTPGGWMTNTAFESAVNGALGTGFEAFCTTDDTPFDPSDERLSPNGKPVYWFSRNEHKVSHNSGQISLISSMPIDTIPPNTAIHRVGWVVNRAKPMSLSVINNGLIVDGVQTFEVVNNVILINESAPKVKF